MWWRALKKLYRRFVEVRGSTLRVGPDAALHCAAACGSVRVEVPEASKSLVLREECELYRQVVEALPT